MRPFYNLRCRFAALEMSQAEVAKSIAMAPSTLSFKMTGKSPFTAWDMEKIAGVLDIPPQDYYKYFIEGAGKH